MADAYLLENGIDRYLLEDGSGVYLLETLGTQYFSDDFNRADGDLGTNWLHATTIANEMQIASNQIVGGAGADIAIHWATPTDTDDQFSQTPVLTVSGTSSGPAVALSGFADNTLPGSNSFTFYRLSMNSASQILLQQKKIDTSNFVTLATYSGLTISVGDVMRLEYLNHVLYAYVGGVLLGSYTPPVGAAITGQRYVGLSLNSSSQSGVPLFDNWSGGDYPTQGAATLTTVSTLTADGTQISGGTTYAGAAALSATSSLTADGVRTAPAAATLSASSTLTADGVRTAPAAATLSATSTLTSAATKTTAGAAALSATSTLTSDGIRTTFGAAALVTTATLTSAATKTTAGAAALSATSTLTSDGIRIAFGTAALTATSSLTADGVRVVAGAAALSASSTLTADGVRVVSGAAALSAVATLTSDGVRTTPGAAALAAVSTLTADGVRTAFGAAALVATATLTSAVTKTTAGAAALTTTATLTADGIRTTAGAAALSASATLTADGIRTALGAAALTSTATLTADGTRAPPTASAALTATSTLTADGLRTAVAAAALVATSTLTGAATKTTAGAAALVATSTLTANGIRTAFATAALVTVSTLTSAGFRLTENVKTDFSTVNPGGIWSITPQGSATVSVTGGQLVMGAGDGVSTAVGYYATNNNAQTIIAGSSIYAQCQQVPNVSNGTTYTGVMWWKDQAVGLNYFGWLWQNGQWLARERAAGAYSDVTMSLTDTWFRIRMSADGSTIYWDSSADGETWTNRRSKATAIAGSAGAGQIVFQTGQFSVPGSTPGSAIWDNLNIKPGAALLSTTATLTANGIKTRPAAATLVTVSTLNADGTVSQFIVLYIHDGAGGLIPVVSYGVHDGAGGLTPVIPKAVM
jgi:hypothetical protein